MTNTDCAARRHICNLGQTGTGMDRAARGATGGWRRLTACALVFALVLQGIAFTLAGARLAADAAAATDFAGFELCRHVDGTAPGGAPETPAADSHCVFCLAGATYILGTPSYAPEFRTIVIAIATWPFAMWRLPATTVDDSARPRGPPPAV
jgi:hypothetical protein